MSDTCYTEEIGGDCTSKRLGEEPDMRLGDICYLCCCRECERCDTLIDLDCEQQINAKSGDTLVEAGPHGGYVDVCDDCLKDDDVLYDPELEEIRREEMAS
jgi:hypothetical protein